MDLRQLRCFVSVAEELHFGRAAQSLHMLPSALGRQIRLLEEEAGTRLLVRTTRRVELTQAGQVMLAGARSLLSDAEHLLGAVRQMGEARPCQLRIGAVDSAAAGFLPDLLYSFRQSHQEVETLLMEEKTSRIIPLLLRGRLDIGFVRPPVPPGRLCFEHLVTEQPVIALPSGHALSRKRQLTPEDLEALPFILPPRRTSPHSVEVAKQLFSVMDLKPRVIQEVDGKQTIVNLVAARMGAAVLPEWMARIPVPGVAYRSLKLRKHADALTWKLGVAWAPDTRHGIRDDFIATLRDWSKQQPSCL